MSLFSNFGKYLSEIKKGIMSASGYILSHHEAHEYYRCYRIGIGKKDIYLCARCAGIYLGLVIGIIASCLEIIDRDYIVYVVSIFPLPLLLGWVLYQFGLTKGNNILRTITGVLMGIAYAYGIKLFIIKFPSFFVLGVAAIYILIIGCVYLVIQSKKKQ